MLICYRKSFFNGIVLLLCLLAPAPSSFAGTTDSLETLLGKTTPDTSRVILLLKLGREYLNNDLAKAEKYNKDALTLSRKLNYTKGLVVSNKQLGASREYAGSKQEALDYLNKAVELAIKSEDLYEEASVYNNMALVYYNHGEYDNSMEYYLRSVQIYEKIKDFEGLATANQGLGDIFRKQGFYSKSQQYFELSLSQFRKAKLTVKEASVMASIGTVYLAQGEHAKALESFFDYLKLVEGSSEQRTIASIYNYIGAIYLSQAEYDNALKYFEKSLGIRESLDDKKGMASAINNIGSVYANKEKFNEALENYFRALKISEELQDKVGIAQTFNNIGKMYSLQKNYVLSLKYLFKSLELKRETGDKEGIATAYNNIGELYQQKGEYANAIEYGMKSLDAAKEINSKSRIKEAYSTIFESYEASGDFKKAMQYYKLYSSVRDSIMNTQNSRILAEVQAQYETEKKEKEITLLTKDNEIKTLANSRQEEQLKRQRILSYFGTGTLLLVIILAYVFYSRYVDKKKANAELEAKNALISKQRNNILDSLNYAEKIQQSILINEEDIQEQLGDAFVFFKPKDIVSGDFYWFSKVGSKAIVAAVDCTGHGVPGAFLSMIGNMLLNEIVNQRGITDPAEILEELHKGIFDALQQKKDDAQQDGMDMSICTIDYEKKKLFFAGAMNPIFVIEPGGEVVTYKGDLKTIGGWSFDGTERKFTRYDIFIEKEMCIYLFTDGFVDQFGYKDGLTTGPKQKFGTPRFRNLLKENAGLPMLQQKQKLQDGLADWKKDFMQIDDILIIGVRIKP